MINMEKIKQKIEETIRRSESIFKTDMVYVVKNGSWSVFGQVASITLSFGLSLCFAHFLPKEVYGNYKFILSITSVIGALSLTGLGTAIVQAVAQGKDRVLHDSVMVSLRWGLIVTAISCATAIYYLIYDNASIAIALLIFGVCSPLINSYGLYGCYWNGKKDFKQSTIFFVLSQTLSSGIMMLAVVFSNNALFLVSVGFIFSALFSVFAYYYIVKKNQINDIGDDSMIRYGKHLSFMNFFGNLANQLDKILVFHWLGAAQLAIYSFATIIPEQVKGSYKTVFGIALPKFSTLSGTGLRKSIVDKVIRLTLISVVIVIAYNLIVPYFFQIFFPKYLSSVWYSQIYILGLVTIPGLSLFSIYFQVLKDTKTLYLVTTLGNIVTIVYSFALIYPFGLMGAVIENGVSWLTMLLISIYFFSRHKGS